MICKLIEIYVLSGNSVTIKEQTFTKKKEIKHVKQTLLLSLTLFDCRNYKAFQLIAITEQLFHLFLILQNLANICRHMNGGRRNMTNL